MWLFELTQWVSLQKQKVQPFRVYIIIRGPLGCANPSKKIKSSDTCKVSEGFVGLVLGHLADMMGLCWAMKLGPHKGLCKVRTGPNVSLVEAHLKICWAT